MDVCTWGVLAYCVRAVEQSPVITKQHAYHCLTKDLTHLESFYLETDCIQDRMPYIRKQWKDCTYTHNLFDSICRKDMTALAEFWRKIKHDLETAILKQHANSCLLEASSTKLMAVGLDSIADTFNNKQKRDRKEASSSSSSSGTRHQTTINSNQTSCFEIDGIYLRSSHLSISKIIWPFVFDQEE
ncbi:hypothetical protein BC941DRAFT_468506 [Chlamydoabsidia padenii]|nr:hypothetical protein BC941DRAFT_468506 [Chlamydoabsidia padenii]